MNKKTQSDNKKISKKILLAIISTIVIMLVIFVVLAIKNDGGEKIICSKCSYLHGADYCNCIEESTVKIISGTDKLKAGECPENSNPVFDEVGGFVGIQFVGCSY